MKNAAVQSPTNKPKHPLIDLVKKSAADYLPKNGDANWEKLKSAAAKCHGCDLYRNATQTVFGSGNPNAKIMFVGEQPGDKEDLQGKPFVGPAGKLLKQALEGSGISEKDVYLTNAVKHFKFQQRGKRRLHGKPGTYEIQACNPWLEAEIRKLKPELIVCLGATAIQSVIGKSLKVNENRGKVLPSAFFLPALVTVHPSSILRITDSDERHQSFTLFVEDLKKIHNLLLKC